VTTDDFVQAMEDATGVSLAQFRRWYDQAGTPELEVSSQYDPVAKTCTVEIAQSCPPTPGQPHKAPFHIPVALGLMDRAGRDLPLQLKGETGPGEGTRVLELWEFEHVFRFVNVPESPILSVLRGFSAPVKLKLASTDADLMFRLAHDTDCFNRWEAGQELATRIILRRVEALGAGREWHLADSFSEAFQQVIAAPDLDAALRAEALTLPGETYLAEQMVVIDVEGIHAARKQVQAILARRLRDAWLALYEANGDEGEYRPDAASIGRRLVKNRALEYLMQLEEPRFRALCLAQFRNASNMTDQLSALGLLVNCDCPERGESLAWFYDRWQHEALVVDKWFALQATSRLPGTLDEVKRLLQHPAFSIKNPNKVRSLIGAFCQLNPALFHRIDGAGYEFLVDQVLALNAINPQIAARLLSALTGWRKHDETRQGSARTQLERVLAAPKLSADVYEIAAKSLDN
jgi:aminopeptidase N